MAMYSGAAFSSDIASDGGEGTVPLEKHYKLQIAFQNEAIRYCLQRQAFGFWQNKQR